MPDNSCHMICALKSVPGLADVGVLQEDGDGPRTPPRCLERSGKSLKWLILLIVSPSTIDKMFEICTFFKNTTKIYTFFEKWTEIYTFFKNRFEIYTFILFENRTKNFKHFVNGRWTQYKHNYNCSMKYVLKSVPPWPCWCWGPHGDGPRTPPRCLKGSGKSFEWLILLCLTIVVLWNTL